MRVLVLDVQHDMVVVLVVTDSVVSQARTKQTTLTVPL